MLTLPNNLVVLLKISVKDGKVEADSPVFYQKEGKKHGARPNFFNVM
jgi:hypothetical protein